MGEDWWKLANGLQRGCYLQLLLLCKDGADNGHLCYKNVTELSVLLSIDVRTTRKVVTFLEHNSCINAPECAEGLFRLFIPKYKFYQELDAKDHAKHIQSKAAKSPPKRVLPDQTRPDSKPDQTKGRSLASNEAGTKTVDNSETAEDIQRQIAESRASATASKMSPLRQSFEDWRESDTVWLDKLRMTETLKAQIKSIDSAYSLEEFVKSYMGDLSHDVYNRPDKFPDIPDGYGWRNLLKGYIRLGIKEKKLGNYGMKNPISASEEHKHEESKLRKV